MLPQPKIIGVDANIGIFPERRAFSGTGHFLLQNKTSKPVAQIHAGDSQQSISNVRFDRPFHKVSSSARNEYSIHALDQPLAPGDKLGMDFTISYATRGFKDGGERPELAYSGTFFDPSYFPSIGYNKGVELSDPRRRREEHLGPVSDLPHRGDPLASLTYGANADMIAFRTTVSTADQDREGKPQIAVAPGYLQRDWHQNGRHYFEYSMGDTKMGYAPGYLSARYEVKRDIYRGARCLRTSLCGLVRASSSCIATDGY